MNSSVTLCFLSFVISIASCFSFIFNGNFLFKTRLLKSSQLYNGMNANIESRKEILYRKYPFVNKSLPLLEDVNNYYSGKFGELFWHQNSQQVYVFIPIDKEISKSDINVKMEVIRIKVNIKGKETIEFDCLDRIITDGSFWVIEKDSDGNKYLMLDLEKRFGSLNWNGLFERHSDEELDNLRKNSKLLESLLAANQGLGKMTGLPPETIEEMLKDENFLNSLNATISETPEIRAETKNGESFDLGSQNVEGFEITSEKLQDIIRNSKSSQNEKIDESIIDAEIAN